MKIYQICLNENTYKIRTLNLTPLSIKPIEMENVSLPYIWNELTNMYFITDKKPLVMCSKNFFITKKYFNHKKLLKNFVKLF